MKRLLRAVYWPAFLLAAAIAMTAATIPLTGPAAGIAAVAAAAAVLTAGNTLQRKDRR